MAISVFGVGAPVVVTNAGVTPPLPAGAQAGDLLVCVNKNVRFALTGTCSTPGLPAGWSRKSTATAVGDVAQMRITWNFKYWASGETAPTISYSGGLAGDAHTAQIIGIRGAPTSGDPTDAISVATLGLADSNDLGPFPGLTTTVDGGIVIVTAVAENDGFADSAMEVLTGDGVTWVEAEDFVNPSTATATFVTDYGLVPTARTITAKLFGAGSGFSTLPRSLGQMWAIKPLAAAAVPVVAAGGDVTNHPVDTQFTRTATSTGSAITSRVWTIQSGPTGAGTTIGTAAALAWTPTTVGSYVLRHTVTDSAGTGFDELSIGVVAPLIWTGDLETGVIGDQFKTNNPNDYESPNENVIDGSVSRAGSFSMRSTINATTTLSGSPMQRAERESRLRDSGVYGNILPGANLWFSLATRLAPGFEIDPPDFQLVTQWKQLKGGSPPLSLSVMGGRFSLDGGFGFPGGPRLMPSQDLGPATIDEWIDWLFYVEFRAGPDAGIISIWRDGVQMLNSYTPPGGTAYPDDEMYWKVGIYRSPDNAVPVTAHLDEMRAGHTRGAVEITAPKPILVLPGRFFLAY